jgi:glutathionylspermidine synthase
MRRHRIEPRPDWIPQVEALGLIYHHTGDLLYWNESAYYAVTPDEVDAIERATAELRALALAAVEHVIERRRYAELGIPAHAVPLIEASWNGEAPSLYGRFDLALTADGPKLLEYNADTPTILLEAAVVQWAWKEARFPAADQYNSIHEKLIAKWADLVPHVQQPVYFAALDVPEDLMTVTYLADTAQQAGLGIERLRVQDVGYAPSRGFTDLQERTIKTIFKLYPWEWLLAEEFGRNILPDDAQWIEPAWKMILSNKGILPILWELNEGHPNLLRAAWKPFSGASHGWVKKPLLGREGDNIEIHRSGGAAPVVMPGQYGGGRFVYQEYAELPVFDGQTAVVGSWEIDGEPAGIGIRESAGPVTVNASPFVPHLIAG